MAVTYKTPVTYTLVDFGGSPTDFTITLALQAGLVISATTGFISGTPTAKSAARVYTVTATDGTKTATATVGIATVSIAGELLSFAKKHVHYTLPCCVCIRQHTMICQSADTPI